MMHARLKRSHFVILSVLMTLLWGSFGSLPSVLAQEGWHVGDLVDLQKGVCIREGPGFSFRAHTKVLEDNWTVRVIDGPRRVDGLLWYDTSRRAAGDPSGGTGWVAWDQSDRDCPEAKAGRASSPATPLPNLPGPPDIPGFSHWQSLIERFLPPNWVQWAWWILILAAVIWLWRKIAIPCFTLFYLGLSGFALWLLFSFTRELWQPLWLDLVGPNAPDLAILAALFPFVSWMVSYLSRRR